MILYIRKVFFYSEICNIVSLFFFAVFMFFICPISMKSSKIKIN